MPFIISKDLLANLYINRKMCIRQISEIVGIPSHSIRKYFTNFGLPLRSAKECNDIKKGTIVYKINHRTGILRANKEPGYRIKRSVNARNQWRDNEVRERSIVSMTAAQRTPTQRQLKSKTTSKQWENPKQRIGVSKFMKDRWAHDTGYRDKMLKLAAFPIRVSPNKSELFLLDILNELYPDEWGFHGNKRTIGTKFPDYLNSKHDMVIELFGEPYHNPEDEGKRISYFGGKGYPCLVVWWKEISTKPNIITLKLKITTWYNTYKYKSPLNPAVTK